MLSGNGYITSSIFATDRCAIAKKKLEISYLKRAGVFLQSELVSRCLDRRAAPDHTVSKVPQARAEPLLKQFLFDGARTGHIVRETSAALSHPEQAHASSVK